MITKIQITGQTQLRVNTIGPTLLVLMLALLSPGLMVLLSGYFKMSFIGGELLFWGLALAILAIVLVWERRPLQSIGFRHFTLKEAGLAIMFAIAMFFSFPLIYWLLSWVNIPIATEMAKALGSLPVPVLFLLALRAGVTEEIIYRGFLLERLLPLTNSKFIAAVLPLLIFVISHLSWGMAHLVFVSFAGGLLSLLYLWKRNLWLNMLSHFMVDILLFLMIPLWL